MGKHTVQKIMLVIVMTVMLMNNLILPSNVVMAENDTDTTEESSSENENNKISRAIPSDGNIYNMETGDFSDGKRTVLETAMKYDPRMHYLTTYAFLVDNFGVSGELSSYNKMYYGNTTFSPLDMKVETDPEEVMNRTLTDIEDDENIDIHNRGKVDKQENDKEFDKTTELAVSYLITEIYFPVTAELITPHYSGKVQELRDLPKSNAATQFGKKHLTDLMSVDRYYDIFLSKSDAKKVSKMFKGKETEHASAQQSFMKEYYNQLYEYLKSNVSKDKTFKQVAKDFVGKNFNQTALQNIASATRKNGKVKVKRRTVLRLNGGRQGFVPTYTMEGSSRAAYDYVMYMPEYMTYVSNESGVEVSEIEDLLNKEIVKRLDARLKDKKGMSKELKEYIKKYDKLVEEKREVDRIVSEKVKDSYRILGWIPIYPDISEAEFTERRFFKSEISKKDFSKYLEKVEKATFDESGVIKGANGRARPLKVNDLFYSSKSSSILTLHTEKTENDYATVKAGKNGNPSKGTSIGKFAGMQSKLAGKKLNTSDLKVEAYSPNKDSYNVQIFRNLAAKNTEYGIGMDVTRDAELGVDTYGNIIDAQSGVILIPYWQNEIMSTLGIDTWKNSKNHWVSHAAYNSEDTTKLVQDVFDSNITILENTVTLEQVEKAFGDKINIGDNFNPVNIAGVKSLIEYHRSQEGTDNRLSDLALAIVGGTHSAVKNFNEKAIEWGRNSQELYVKTGIDGYATGLGDSDGGTGGYTNDDLRERIMYHLDFGFGDVIRLTATNLFSYIYNSTITHSLLSWVFYTTPITDTPVWEDVVKSLIIWLVGLMGIYVIYMAFQIFRNVITFGDFVKRFIMVTLIILIPSVIYSPLINLMINKPSEWIVGKQMQQLAVLEYADDLSEEMEERDPAYQLLFGDKLHLRDRSQDFIVEFYTSQHKNGFDVNNIESTEDMSYIDQIKTNRAERTGKWGKEDLVKVNVSMFDLFTWARARIDKDLENIGISSTDDDLFTWLQTSSDANGDYADVAGYTEYMYDPNLRNVKLGDLDNSTETLDKITASELFLRMYEASSSEVEGGSDLSKRLGDLVEIANVVKVNDPKNPIAVEEVNAIVRDLSLTRAGRESLYGYKDMGSSIEYIPGVYLDTYGKSGSVDKVPAISEKTRRVWERTTNTSLRVPNSDYLSMENVIGDIYPQPQDPRDTTLERYVYDINEKVLNDYINIHHIVRASVGGVGANRDIRDSEFMLITLNQFFRTNEVLDIPMFPRTILPSTYSLDTYTRMAYVPVAEYKDSESVAVNNVGEYLSLRENLVVLFVFFLSLIALIVWGLVYFVVFGFLMLILSVVSFIWNYVIKIGDSSKESVTSSSWFNALLVIVVFSVAKIGLMLLWYGMYYAMNEMMLLHGGLTYPYVLVHSILVITYIIIAFRFALWGIIKRLYKEPLKLGGEDLSKEVFGKLGRSSTGGIGGRGRRGFGRRGFGRRGFGGYGSRGMRVSAISRHLGQTGSNGVVGVGKIGKSITGTIGKAGKSIGKGARGVRELGSVAAGKLKPNTSKYSITDNPLTRKLGFMNAHNYEKIDGNKGASGVSQEKKDEMKASGAVGQIISTTADGEEMTVLTVGNKAMAKNIVKSMKENGMKAAVNKDNNVVFNSSGYDMEDNSVRKHIFGNLIDKLQKDLEETEAVDMKRVKKKDLINYTRSSDGIVTIPVGRNGLYGTSLDTLMNSQEFLEAFVVEGTPTKDGNGNYNDGSVDVRVRKGVNAERALRKIYELDTGLRGEEKSNKRGSIEYNRSIDFEGIESRKDIRAIAEKHGMLVQDGRILYNSKDENHNIHAAEIQQILSEEYVQEMGDKKKLMNKAISYTVQGEDNGFLATTFNINSEEGYAQGAEAAGMLLDGIETKVFAGSESQNIVENLEKYQSVVNATGRKEFATSLKELYSLGEGTEGVFLRGYDKEVQYDKGINNLVKASQQAGVDVSLVNDVTKQYNQLGKDRSNAIITEEEYHNKVQNLFEGFQNTLKEKGEYSTVISNHITNGEGNIEKTDKKILDNFVKVKQGVEEEGASSKVLERAGTDTGEIEDVLNLVEDIKGIDDKGDGVVNITSGSKLNDGDAARLIARLSGKFEG